MIKISNTDKQLGIKAGHGNTEPINMKYIAELAGPHTFFFLLFR